MTRTEALAEMRSIRGEVELLSAHVANLRSELNTIRNTIKATISQAAQLERKIGDLWAAIINGDTEP